MQVRLQVENFSAWYAQTLAVKDVSLQVVQQEVTAIIGPSGCGKSTMIRSFNRMHETIPGARTAGRILLDGTDIYADAIDPVEVRRKIGMVFQKPNPFPTMSIWQNVAVGLQINGLRQGASLEEIVEKSLRRAALWDEVKDRLQHSGASLSGGQQQRLCIARALAVEPEVLLMDEPCSALDPLATLKIEELISELKDNFTIVMVTHNMQQAARVAGYTAFFLHGEMAEYGPTAEIFTKPMDKRTEDYITGRFG